MRQKRIHKSDAGAVAGLRDDFQVGVPGDAPGRPADEAVARRAYELYLGRGAEGGRELEDWFRAEAELRGGL